VLTGTFQELGIDAVHEGFDGCRQGLFFAAKLLATDSRKKEQGNLHSCVPASLSAIDIHLVIPILVLISY
jgi:hypothetical protein